MSRSSGHDDRSLPLVCILLFTLLAVLAALQYRWLGTLSEAERSRLHAGARERAESFAREFDREITRVFAWLHVRPDELQERIWDGYAERVKEWSRIAEEPSIVARIYLAEKRSGESWQLSFYDRDRREFRECAWPAALAPIRRHIAAIEDPEPMERRQGLRFDFMARDPPAVLVPVPDIAFDSGEDSGYRGVRFRLAALSIIRLDLDTIRKRILPDLAERHFSEDGDLVYDARVADRRDPRAILYQSSAHEHRSTPGADAEATLFAIRPEELLTEDRVLLGHGGMSMFFDGARRREASEDRPSMNEWTRISRGPRRAVEAPPGRAHLPRALHYFARGRFEEGGAWRLSATHRSGSIDVVVASTRRRNLAVSFGIMLILATSVVLIVLSAQRARRLARREVEFVASVTHELRTPLSVILSASENLADGVVRDAARTESYGELIRDEAKRLGEMVERTLAYAGSNLENRRDRMRRLEAADLVNDALLASSEITSREDAQIEVNGMHGLPAIEGDRDALVRALRNLIENALKYGGGSRRLRIVGSSASRRGLVEVRFSVEDQGVGIPKDEQRMIFEPFWRGREALENQVRGSGLGLTIVRRIAEAHAGRVEVRSEPGRGSVFTLVLPATRKTEKTDHRAPDATSK